MKIRIAFTDAEAAAADAVILRLRAVLPAVKVKEAKDDGSGFRHVYLTTPKVHKNH